MKKKFITKKGMQFIYHLDRTCRYCAAPIAENSSAKREYCPITHGPDGKVRDCKSAFHLEKNKPDRDNYAMIISNNKAIYSRIEYLIGIAGENVTSQDLDTYRINLIECLNATKINGLVYWYFLKHVIITNPTTKTHKIERHDKYTDNGAIA